MYVWIHVISYLLFRGSHDVMMTVQSCTCARIYEPPKQKFPKRIHGKKQHHIQLADHRIGSIQVVDHQFGSATLTYKNHHSTMFTLGIILGDDLVPRLSLTTASWRVRIRSAPLAGWWNHSLQNTVDENGVCLYRKFSWIKISGQWHMKCNLTMQKFMDKSLDYYGSPSEDAKDWSIYSMVVSGSPKRW